MTDPSTPEPGGESVAGTTAFPPSSAEAEAQAAVVMPSGRTLAEAAAWVGHACWAELRLHEVLTGWLADETDDAAASQLWSARSGAVERAAAWHRRLPELRELPRADFVAPSSAEVAAWFDTLAVESGSGSHYRVAAARIAIEALRAGYEVHQEVAVGPADGPVARTLAEAVGSIGLTAPPADADAVADHPVDLVPPLP